MLDTTAPFPYPGALALLDGFLVRIRERCGDEALVFGASITRRVPVADLAPPPEPTVFERWRAERVVGAVESEARTLAADVFADYSAWLAAAGLEAAYPVTEYAFERLMWRAGYPVTSGFWRNPGEQSVRTRRLYRLALRSGAPA